MIISALYLDSIEWLKPAAFDRSGNASILPTYLLFSGFSGDCFAIVPVKALIRGTFIAALSVLVIKIIARLYAAVTGEIAFPAFCPYSV